MISNLTSYLQGVNGEKETNKLVDKFNRTNKGEYKLKYPGSGGFQLFRKDGKEISLPLVATPKTPN